MSSYDPEFIYLVDHGGGDPAWNMAVDDALLAAHDGGRLAGTWFRLFAWQPPAVSIGRLQEASGELEVARLARDGVTVVRRATGGKAVYHDDELTYSVVGAIGHPDWGDTLHATYRAVTAVIAAALERLGVSTRLAAGRPPASTLDHDTLRAACFAVAYGHELLHGGRKICGSAQRRLVRAFLQHGSLLLGPGHARLAAWVRTGGDRRALARRLRGLATDAGTARGRPVSYPEASRAIIDSLAERFTHRLELRTTLPAAILAAADRRLDAVRVPLDCSAVADDVAGPRTMETR